ncbi:hypothetical protein ILYODFUR_029656 [Ilyodon furcidens]|uniref:Uncharacterized protein n=1 Tax=Ilyodon furcidens TaxID=33524 RepID=A0ABV0SSG9_9TELE
MTGAGQNTDPEMLENICRRAAPLFCIFVPLLKLQYYCEGEEQLIQHRLSSIYNVGTCNKPVALLSNTQLIRYDYLTTHTFATGYGGFLCPKRRTLFVVGSDRGRSVLRP